MIKLKVSNFLTSAVIGASLVLMSAFSVQAASYTIAPGDSIYKISKLFNTSADYIMSNNNLSGSLIYPGQILNVPCQVYTVQNGDSLYLISKRNGISLSILRKANNKWDDYIYPGQKLNLPKAGSTVQSVSSNNTASYSNSDFDLLARLITAEAQDQPYNAMVGVGAVVLNRVKSSEFPNTLGSVIYQKDSGYYQFTPVENGWINKPATQSALNAAKDALNGSDPTHGALYYFDDSATNRWLRSKPVLAQFGNMIFAY